MALAVAPTPALRAVLYGRVSTLTQRDAGYSLAAQDKDCERLADDLGATIIARYEDADSGAEWNLPGLTAVLDAARRREFDILICYDPDRFARNVAKQLVLEEELRRSGVTIHYVTLRVDNSPEGRLLKNMRGSIAEYEREKILMRTLRGRREKAERGLVVGVGRAPYGYRYIRVLNAQTNKYRVEGLEEDPTTAPVVRRIFAAAAHTSLNQICAALIAEGVPGYRGGRWTTTTVGYILRNPVYLGQAAYGRHQDGRMVDASKWILVDVPPLVDQETRDRVDAALPLRRSRRRVRMAPSEDPYILRELLTCGHCGGALACMSSRQYRYYDCLRHRPRQARMQGRPLCSLPMVPAEASKATNGAEGLEAHAWALITDALLDPERLRQGLADGRATHEAADRSWQERRRNLDRLIKRERAALKVLVLDRAAARRGGETWRALDEAVQDTERKLGKLADELGKLHPTDLPGLSARQADALTAFAAEVRAGIALATPAQQRHVCQMLRLTGRVTEDRENGVRLGRDHRYTIDWEALISLRDNDRVLTRMGDSKSRPASPCAARA
jgi:site-specific DNA recombinase